MITVFIGTFNRLETLERSVTSYQAFEDELELVIVDNGTEHPRALEMLAKLEHYPLVKKIYSMPRVYTMEAITDNFNVAVQDQYDTGDAEWFAISEADICFSKTAPAAIKAYLMLAKDTGRAVGPHLRVDGGIPWYYPFRSRVLSCEARLLYRDSMQWFMGEVPYSPWQIDTTFHLFPRTRFFNRLHMDTLRVGPPFDALHLDWYLDITNPTEENSIYIQNEHGIGSWGRLWLSDYWYRFQEDKEAAFEHLLTVPRVNGDLCNTSFLLSWCYQYGQGVEPNQRLSQQHLLRAIPNEAPYHQEQYWAHQKDWLNMIYRNDFSSLGWDYGCG